MNFLYKLSLMLVTTGGVFALNPVRATEQIEHDNVAFDVAPRGDRIVFSAADGDLYLFNLKSRAVTRLTKTAVQESTPSFSPDGRFIVYTTIPKGENGAHIFLRSLDGKTTKQLTTNKAVSDAEPHFSADGKQIVFVRANRYRQYSMGGMTWDNYDVCSMKRDGTGMKQLTRQKYDGAGSPHFINNDQTVVYSSGIDNGRGDYSSTLKLLVVPAQGTQAPRVLSTLKKGQAPSSQMVAEGSAPSISRDGKRIVFLSDQVTPYAYDFYVMDAKGTNIAPLNITNISGYNENAVFAPDGKSVLFLAGTERNASSRAIFSLWSVGVDGKNARQIADSGLFTTPSVWKPKK